MQVLTSAETRDFLQTTGEILCRLPPAHRSLGMVRSHVFDAGYGQDRDLAYGYNSVMPNRITPSAAEITLADLCCGWLQLIPDEPPNVRRVVAMRMVRTWRSDRCVYPYRVIGARLGLRVPAIRRMEDRGIAIITRRINHSPALLAPLARFRVDQTTLAGRLLARA